MNPRFYLLIIFNFLLLMPVATSQLVVLEGDERERMERDVLTAYPHQFNSIEIVSMERLDEVLLQFNYRSEGKVWQAILQTDDTEPVLVETGQVLTPSEWPEIIVDAWKKSKMASHAIQRMLKVSTPYGHQGYRVELESKSDSSGQKPHLYFDVWGQQEKPFYY